MDGECELLSFANYSAGTFADERCTSARASLTSEFTGPGLHERSAASQPLIHTEAASHLLVLSQRGIGRHAPHRHRSLARAHVRAGSFGPFRPPDPHRRQRYALKRVRKLSKLRP